MTLALASPIQRFRDARYRRTLAMRREDSSHVVKCGGRQARRGLRARLVLVEITADVEAVVAPESEVVEEVGAAGDALALRHSEPEIDALERGDGARPGLHGADALGAGLDRLALRPRARGVWVGAIERLVDVANVLHVEGRSVRATRFQAMCSAEAVGPCVADDKATDLAMLRLVHIIPAHNIDCVTALHGKEVILEDEPFALHGNHRLLDGDAAVDVTVDALEWARHALGRLLLAGELLEAGQVMWHGDHPDLFGVLPRGRRTSIRHASRRGWRTGRRSRARHLCRLLAYAASRAAGGRGRGRRVVRHPRGRRHADGHARGNAHVLIGAVRALCRVAENDLTVDEIGRANAAERTGRGIRCLQGVGHTNVVRLPTESNTP
eukprot:scaffold160068_cov35-Tisochrysis_lutea.AAC.2